MAWPLLASWEQGAGMPIRGGSVAAGCGPGRNTDMLSRLHAGARRGGDFWHVVGLLLLLGLVASALATTGAGDPGQVPAEVLPAAAAQDADPAAIRIRFELPPAQPGDPPWVVWLPRVARDAVWL